MDEKLRFALQQRSLSELEWKVLQCIIRVPIRAEGGIPYIRDLLDFNGEWPLLEEVQQAANKLVDAQLIQTLDEDQAKRMRADIKSTQADGIATSLPSTGFLDLTRQGAATVMDVWRVGYGRQPDEFSTNLVRKIDEGTDEITIWGSKYWMCYKQINEIVRLACRVICDRKVQRQYYCKLLSLSTPQECGPFRDHWWREPTGGWTITGTYQSIVQTLPAAIGEDE